jgi:dTDP-4-dehydrorhamnose reductase
MSREQALRPALEMWGGVECTVNRVANRWFDQLQWSGHDHRLDDLDRIAALGIRVLRYPVLWERLAPSASRDIDWRWADERLGRLRELGINPIVGLLHHGSGPAYTSLLDPAFPAKLAHFAGAVARRYPWMQDFTPVNEPLTTARFSGLYGHWYPHGRSDCDYVRALLNQLQGVVRAMTAIREVIPNARLIQTEDCGRTYGRGDTRSQVAHEGHRRWLTWDLLTGRVDQRHPLYRFLKNAGMTSEDETFFRDAVGTPDVLGLNYYVTSDRFLDDRLDQYPAAMHGGNGIIRYADVDAVRARAEGITGHEAHLIDAWLRYRIPVAVTEVHLGCTRDEQLRWLLEAWTGAHSARRAGADVRAVTAWALFGSYNWDSLVTRDAGSYEPGAFDVRDQTPRPTAVAKAISALATGAEPKHAVLGGTPWWRQPVRISYAATTVASQPTGGPPLLIVGATGTLGRALQRVCDLRGLPSHLAGRHEVDVTDAARVDAIIRRLEPWAVINATGFVRVDDAEREQQACRRVNVAGAVNLAAACRRQGVPMVTFSSDLVFDGQQQHPYVESDVVAPLNVYGATKAEAERHVLEVLPHALVVRTSAFFGPWDDYNFLAAVFRTLDTGAVFRAPADSMVSPTYVPELAHVVLDLLIDGESGVWHLANAGAVTWFDFARIAAERSGRVADSIEPAPTKEVWGPAVRPCYSVLASQRGQLLRPLDAALERYLQELPAARAATGTDACVSR